MQKIKKSQKHRFARLYKATGDTDWIFAYAAESGTEQRNVEASLPTIEEFCDALEYVSGKGKSLEEDDVQADFVSAAAIALVQFYHSSADLKSPAFVSAKIDDIENILSDDVVLISKKELAQLAKNIQKNCLGAAEDKCQEVLSDPKKVEDLIRYTLTRAYIVCYHNFFLKNPHIALFNFTSEVPLSLAPKLAAKAKGKDPSKQLSTLVGPVMSDWAEALDINALKVLSSISAIQKGVYSSKFSDKELYALKYAFVANKANADHISMISDGVRRFLEQNPQRKSVTVKGAPVMPDMHIGDLIQSDQYKDNAYSFLSVSPGAKLNANLRTWNGTNVSASTLTDNTVTIAQMADDYVPTKVASSDFAGSAYKSAIRSLDSLYKIASMQPPMLAEDSVSLKSVISSLSTAEEAKKVYSDIYRELLVSFQSVLPKHEEIDLNNWKQVSDKADADFEAALQKTSQALLNKYGSAVKKKDAFIKAISYIAHHDLCFPAGISGAISTISAEDFKIAKVAHDLQVPSSAIDAIILIYTNMTPGKAKTKLDDMFLDMLTDVHDSLARDESSDIIVAVSRAREKMRNRIIAQASKKADLSPLANDLSKMIVDAVMVSAFGKPFDQLSEDDAPRMTEWMNSKFSPGRKLKDIQQISSDFFSTKSLRSTGYGIVSQADQQNKEKMEVLFSGSAHNAIERLKTSYFATKFDSNAQRASQWMSQNASFGYLPDRARQYAEKLEDEVERLSSNDVRKKLGLPPTFEAKVDAPLSEGKSKKERDEASAQAQANWQKMISGQGRDWLNSVRRFILENNTFEKLQEKLGGPEQVDAFFVKIGREISVIFRPDIVLAVAKRFRKANRAEVSVGDVGQFISGASDDDKPVSMAGTSIGAKLTIEDYFNGTDPAIREAMAFVDELEKNISFKRDGTLHAYSFAGALRDFYVFEHKSRTADAQEDRDRYSKYLNDFLADKEIEEEDKSKPLSKSQKKKKDEKQADRLLGFVIGRVKQSFGKMIDSRNRSQLTEIFRMNALKGTGISSMSEFAEAVGAFADPTHSVKTGRPDTALDHLYRSMSAVGQISGSLVSIKAEYIKYFSDKKKEILAINDDMAKYIVQFSMQDRERTNRPFTQKEMDELKAFYTPSEKDKLGVADEHYDVLSDPDLLGSILVKNKNDLKKVFRNIPQSFLDPYVSSMLSQHAYSIIAAQPNVYKDISLFMTSLHEKAMADRNISSVISSVQLKDALDAIGSVITVAKQKEKVIVTAFSNDFSKSKKMQMEAEEVIKFPIPTGYSKAFTANAIKTAISMASDWLEEFENVHPKDILDDYSSAISAMGDQDIREEYGISSVEDFRRDPDRDEIFSSLMDMIEVPSSDTIGRQMIMQALMNPFLEELVMLKERILLQKNKLEDQLERVSSSTEEEDWQKSIEMMKSNLSTIDDHTDIAGKVTDPAKERMDDVADLSAVEEPAPMPTIDRKDAIVSEIMDLGTKMLAASGNPSLKSRYLSADKSDTAEEKAEVILTNIAVFANAVADIGSYMDEDISADSLEEFAHMCKDILSAMQSAQPAVFEEFKKENLAKYIADISRDYSGMIDMSDILSDLQDFSHISAPRAAKDTEGTPAPAQEERTMPEAPLPHFRVPPAVSIKAGEMLSFEPWIEELEALSKSEIMNLPQLSDSKIGLGDLIKHLKDSDVFVAEDVGVLHSIIERIDAILANPTEGNLKDGLSSSSVVQMKHLIDMSISKVEDDIPSIKDEEVKELHDPLEQAEGWFVNKLSELAAKAESMGLMDEATNIRDFWDMIMSADEKKVDESAVESMVNMVKPILTSPTEDAIKKMFSPGDFEMFKKHVVNRALGVFAASHDFGIRLLGVEDEWILI